RIDANAIVLARGEADAVEDVVNLAGRNILEQPGRQFEVLAACEILVKGGGFDGDAYRSDSLFILFPDINAENSDAAAGGADKTRDHVEGGALARAVRTQEAGHVPRLNL